MSEERFVVLTKFLQGIKKVIPRIVSVCCNRNYSPVEVQIMDGIAIGESNRTSPTTVLRTEEKQMKTVHLSQSNHQAQTVGKEPWSM